jgi:hypothetical protein
MWAVDDNGSMRRLQAEGCTTLSTGEGSRWNNFAGLAAGDRLVPGWLIEF